MGQPSVDAFDEVEADAETLEEAAPTRSRQSLKLHGHTQNVNCLAALADGRLASGSSDHSIIIWNLADGKQLATLDGHEGGVRCLAALEGGRLASGSSDKTGLAGEFAVGAGVPRTWDDPHEGCPDDCGPDGPAPRTRGTPAVAPAAAGSVVDRQGPV